jgi:MATE family multidrug resistance protein
LNVLIFGALNGSATACDTLLPQLFGGKDKKKFGTLFQKALVISIFTAFPCMTVLLNSRHVLVLVIKENEVIE